MEWWPVNANSCAANGQAANTNVQFVADSPLEQQLPPLVQHHQQAHQQQQQQQNQPAADFDPWLACDDLELGTIIQQVSSGVMSSPSCSDASISQTPLVGIGAKQEQEPYADSNILPSPQSRRGSENKQHIISIINNSLPPAYQHVSGQQQQRRNNSMTTGSSITVSPLSPSLGSSPLNSLSSNYSSLSFNSPPPPSWNHISGQEQHQQQPRNQTYRIGDIDEFHLHQQQQQQQQQAHAFDGSNARLGIPTSGSSMITSTHGTMNSAQTGARMSAGGNRYSQSKMTVSSSQLQNAGLGASLLLTHAKPQTKAPTRQARKTSSAIAEAPNLGAQAHKQRRCRHITDFVLAEEEKRLLIKEGHTDFPIDCQLRPLTKMEERILRKIRRKIRNKKSAQCSRQRKKEYVEELELKYAETVRENIELKQLLANIHSSSSSERHQEHEFHDNQNKAASMRFGAGL